jgi:hypothetical protein
MEVSGTAYWAGTKERVLNATVKATGKGEPQHVLTNDDGDFSFKDLQTGEWTFVAMQEESFPSKPQKVNITDNMRGLSIYLSRLAGNSDQRAGYIFFGILLALFGACLVLYVVLHNWLPLTQQPISVVLGDQVAAVIQQIGGIDKISQDKVLLDVVARFNKGIGSALDVTTVLNQADKDLLIQTGVKVTEAIEAEDKAGALEQLAFLQKELTAPARKGFATWNSDPWRMLEILFWGLAGVLINKIIVSGWYLRSHRFYREGIVMHVAHLVSTPLLVLVAVLLLSLVSVKVTVAGSDLTLDLSNPSTMIVAAFLLGTVSWPLWDFIEGTAKRITGPQS